MSGYKSLILCIVFLLSLQSEASNVCARLLANGMTDAKKSSVIEILKPLVVEFQSQKQTSNRFLSVRASVLENLTWMRAELESVRRIDLTGLALEQQQIVMREIKKLQNDLEVATKRETISYIDYVVLAQRYSAGISYKFTSRFEELDVALTFQQTHERIKGMLQDKAAKELVEKINEKSDYFYLPSKDAMGFATMNALQANGVAVMGLTSRIEVVDARVYLPVDFFRHDEGHAAGYEAQPFLSYRPEETGGQGYPVLGAKQRARFLTHFQGYLKESKLTPREKQIAHALWFITFHETGLPIHPNNLNSHMKTLLGLDGVEMASRVPALLGRLNDHTDLGYSFREQKVTETEIHEAGKRLIEFSEK